jgi:hypothetical protein
LTQEFRCKSAFATGAGAGFGRDFVLALPETGARIAVADFRSAATAKAVTKIDALGGTDFMINNAARLLLKYSQRPDKLKRQEIHDLFPVNVIGRGEISDITALMPFPRTPASSFITGETIRCSGGFPLSTGWGEAV